MKRIILLLSVTAVLLAGCGSGSGAGPRPISNHTTTSVYHAEGGCSGGTPLDPKTGRPIGPETSVCSSTTAPGAR
jgi:hypothetical protein